MDTKFSSRPLLTLKLAIVGGIAGLGFYFIPQLGFNSFITDALRFAILIAANLYGFATPINFIKRFIITSLGIVIIYAFLGATITNSYQFPYSPNTYASLLFLASFYIAFCFQQTYLEIANNRSYKLTYSEIAWNYAFIILISLIFTLICQLILLISSYLFKNFGFAFFYTLITSSAFSYPVSGLLLGIGIAICKKYTTIIIALRRLVFALSYFLLPVLAAIGILLVIALIFGTQHTTGSADSFVLLTIIALFLINAVYQLKEQTLPYPHFLTYLINIFIIVLPIFPSLSIWQTIHSPTMSNIKNNLQMDIGFYSILLLYSLGYLITLFSSKTRWLKWLPEINIILGIITLITGLIINIPIIN